MNEVNLSEDAQLVFDTLRSLQRDGKSISVLVDLDPDGSTRIESAYEELLSAGIVRHLAASETSKAYEFPGIE